MYGTFLVLLFQLVDASTLKKEVAEGVDIMVVRELTGGLLAIYMFGLTFTAWFLLCVLPFFYKLIIHFVVIFCSNIGIYFGKPRGFGKDENGEETGFNTEVYAGYEVIF